VPFYLETYFQYDHSVIKDALNENVFWCIILHLLKECDYHELNT